MKYLKKARLILARDGFPALLVKIRNKIFHIFTHRIFSFIVRRRQVSPLGQPRPISLATHQDEELIPQVSLVIYVDESAPHTYNCLVSLQKNVANLSSCEIIIISDDRSLEMQKFLQSVQGVKIIQNKTPLGSTAAWQAAAQVARGEFLCFLDRYCQVNERWLSNLLATIEKSPQIAAVSSKLIYEDGKLHNAGGIIWQDGTCQLYGHQDDPEEAEYNYTRPVDFGFLIGLTVRASFWQKLAGFSSNLSNPLYISADFGLKVDQLNQYEVEHRLESHRIIYQPKAELLYRCSSKTKESKASADRKPTLEESEREKLSHQWQQQLTKFLPYSTANLQIAPRRSLPQPTILVIDTLVPFYDKESGANRLFNILKIIQSFQCHIIFLPDYGHNQDPYTSELENLGIEVLDHTHRNSNWESLLKPRLPLIDLAWVCRPELCQKYFPTLRTKPDIKIIYDTIDLHFVRMKREWEIAQQLPKSHQFQTEEEGELAWQEMQTLEVTASRAADTTIVVTEVEKQTLSQLEAGKVSVVPNIHKIYNQSIPKFRDRADLLFIGGYYHNPNVDAVIWLCQEIMPLVWAVEPNIKLTLLGSNPSPAVKSLANERVSVPGYIKDVEPYFLNHRLFVAPLRYGAGMKGKIGHSLSYGLPTVTTSIGAEGMHLIDGKNTLIADNAQSLATAILELYQNEELWQLISHNSQSAIANYSPESVRSIIGQLLGNLLPDSPNFHLS